MHFDKNKFYYYVRRADLTTEKLAEILEISVATLYRKINGTSDFYRNEILLIQITLKLSDDERDELFFAENLA